LLWVGGTAGGIKRVPSAAERVQHRKFLTDCLPQTLEKENSSQASPVGSGGTKVALERAVSGRSKTAIKGKNKKKKEKKSMITLLDENGRRLSYAPPKSR